MKILVSGSSGLIGQALSPALRAAGYEVSRLKTGVAADGRDIRWDPLEPLASASVSGFDAVIHLAGENVFGRWSEGKKRSIYDSRVRGTRNLCAALAAAERKPRMLMAASAIGYYGGRHGDEFLDEDSTAGDDFLACVCCDWEAATSTASRAGIRVVNLRFGVVLSREGGALAQMLTPFRFGVGGALGSGRQWLSWISIHDAVSAISHGLAENQLKGAVNLAAPNPVTNAEFAETLGQVLHRPSLMRVPELALKIIMGPEMAENTVLSSQRVLPKKLLASGFQFRSELLTSALNEALGRG
jgi:uncharacterized protein (TIGR01777 family)